MSTLHETGSTAVTQPDPVSRHRSRLMHACRQIEGLFISHLMAAMDRPTFGQGVFGNSPATELFRDRRNEALADEMGAVGALGLAEMLFQDLSGHASAEVADADAPGTPADTAQGVEIR